MILIITASIIGVVLLFASFLLKQTSSLLHLVTVLFAALFGVAIWESLQASAVLTQSFYLDAIRVDRFTNQFNVLVTGCLFLYILLMKKHIAAVGKYKAEYFALIAFIMVGIFMLSSFNSLLVMFLGIEIVSIPQYILAGSDKENLKSTEASLKYFLMGAFSTGFLLMGITLLYGATGNFMVSEFNFLQATTVNPLALGGVLLLIIAFGFKVSAAPMHLWTPDVYDGTPTPFTAFMATLVKVAAFVGFMRLFQTSFTAISSSWSLVLSVVIALTLLIGNITAVFQQSVKRMLAYSSIAQAGFMLFAIISLNAIGRQGMLVYTIAYSVASISFFAVLIKMKDYTYDGFNGLAKKQPYIAALATIYMLSLAGIPLTGGFMAKYYMLKAVLFQGSYMWLAIFALLMAAVSVYYYFKVIIAMYFKEGEAATVEPFSKEEQVYLTIGVLSLLVVGIFPSLFTGSI
jgi:NADH-quinone oxidoreductase subunit N